MQRMLTQFKMFQVSAHTWMYDIVDDKWTKSTDMKSARSGHQCLNINNTIFIIGGYVDEIGEELANTLEIWRHKEIKAHNWISEFSLETWKGFMLFLGPIINLNTKKLVFQATVSNETTFNIASQSTKTYPLMIARSNAVTFKLPYGFLTNCNGNEIYNSSCDFHI